MKQKRQRKRKNSDSEAVTARGVAAACPDGIYYKRGIIRAEAQTKDDEAEFKGRAHVASAEM